MTENKRFIIDIGEPQHETAFFEYDEHFDDYDFVCWADDIDEILKKFNELGNEIEQLKKERKGFESCSHNWRILYDEAKNKVEELSKENKELKFILQDMGLIMSDEEVKDIREEIASKLIKPICKGNGFDVDVDCTNGFTIIYNNSEW